jgi:hypothetical protein
VNLFVHSNINECGGWPYQGWVSDFQCQDDSLDPWNCPLFPGPWCTSSGYFECTGYGDPCTE